MIRSRHGRRLENCKNLNGIAIQIVYRRCGCAWLLFCFFNGARTRRTFSLYLCLCTCLAKRTDVSFKLVSSTNPCIRTCLCCRPGLRRALTSHLPFIKFLISKWSKPKNRGNRQNTGSYGHISAFHVPNFRENFFSRHANATGACADTIVPRSPSLIVFLIAFFCEFIFLVFCFS